MLHSGSEFLVSVVMPVHNGGEYLATAVHSILTQTHTRLELLLVDDHSTDDAIAELDRSDSRLHIFKSKGRGVVSASNTGFDRCRGDFIARMDADDISLPRRLEIQLQYLQKNPQIDIAGCCVEIFSDSGVMGGFRRYQDWLNSVLEPDQVHNQIFIECPMPNPATMFRRTAFERLEGYRDTSWPEDYDLFLRADTAAMKMAKPDLVLFRWREHADRLTHTDARYKRDRFMQAKSHFLVQHRLKGDPVIIWGAGESGKRIHDLLLEEGGEVEGFIEVHPRRIGGRKRGLPVWAVDKIQQDPLPMVLVAVGSAGARSEIATFMQTNNKVEGSDYLFVA